MPKIHKKVKLRVRKSKGISPSDALKVRLEPHNDMYAVISYFRNHKPIKWLVTNKIDEAISYLRRHCDNWNISTAEIHPAINQQ